jgi:CRISPR/Cas system Type II protein with McrA/HNH and RuvC-like nuclease domain
VTGAAHKETIQSPSDYKGRGVAVNEGKGMCDNGDMSRVDVFTKEGKYYLVPIYVADCAKEELPNKAIVAGKGKEWIEMDGSYQFLFSLAKGAITTCIINAMPILL